MVAILCIQCKNVIHRPICYLKKVKKPTCSKACARIIQKKRVLKNCKICNVPFEVRPTEAKKFSTCNNPQCRQENKLGERNPNWRGGISSERNKDCSSDAYKLWRFLVYERDNYTCQDCGKRGGNLSAHHIMPWSFFIDLRYVVSNGKTLCLECHKKTYKEASEWRKFAREQGCDMEDIVDRDSYIGVDLDRTLAYYNSGDWERFGPYYIGEPIPPMIKKVKEWLASGEKVKIFSARAAETDPKVVEAVEEWCLKHIGQILPVTCIKDRHMRIYYDDKAIQVIPNTGEIVNGT